jgi:hypothetical protein
MLDSLQNNMNSKDKSKYSMKLFSSRTQSWQGKIKPFKKKREMFMSWKEPFKTNYFNMTLFFKLRGQTVSKKYSSLKVKSNK